MLVTDSTMKTIFCIILCINCLGVCKKLEKQQNGTTQVFDITCDPLNKQGECHSETLGSIAAKVEDNSDVSIILKLSTLKLNDTVKFGNLNSLTISGEAGLTAIVCSARESNAQSSRAGIVFSDINGTLTLKNLNLSFCGSHFKNQFNRNQTLSSTLTIIQCTDVEIDRLVVGRSEGVGLVIFNHVGGKVNIKSSVFVENKLTQNYSEQSVKGGGGVYVQLGHFMEIPYLPMSFSFHNCSFDSNVGHTDYYSFHYTNILGATLKGYGKGGGASVTIKKGISNILLSFSECRFVSNQAFFGAGLSVSAYRNGSDHNMSNITVEIKDSVIKENGCGDSKQTYYGGGVYLSFSTSFFRSVIRKSHYLVRNISFIRNCAELGGGVLYFSDQDRKDIGDNVKSSALFQNCTFKGNKAFVGSSIVFSPNIVKKPSTGYTVIVPTIRDCRFIENSITVHSRQTQHGNQLVGGRGTVYSSQYSFQLQGYNHFESNWGTAMYVVDSTINLLSSNATFINNTGSYGGAVALIGSSQMIVGPNDYSFLNNTALYEGGALYAKLDDILDFVSSRSCFIRYEDDKSQTFSEKWNSNIVFTGNKAMNGRGGHAIYATSLHSCQMIYNGTNDNYTVIDASKVFHAQGMIFDNNRSLQPQISTAGGLFRGNTSLPLNFFPGKEHAHGVTVVDDINQTITEVTFLSTIRANALNITLASLYTKDRVTVMGEPAHNANLSLKTTTSRAGYFTLEVSLLECPPGFKLNQDKTCICNVDSHVGMVKCDMEKFHSYLVRGYWIGRVRSPNGSSVLATSGCPFCDYGSSTSNGSEFEVVLPQSYHELDKAVCGETRTGVVCGKCREGYSVHFHSPGFLCKSSEPVGCRLGWLIYILSELVPVTLLFVIVLVLNINFTSGALNGFILYSQLLVTLDMDASGTIALPNSLRESIWTQGFHVIYGLFNLDAFNSEPLSFCLWKGASALDILAIKYITILYALLLIVIVTFVMKRWSGLCCRKCCRITTVRNSVVRGISTFLVICYAQCLNVSLNLLTPVEFHFEDGNSIFSLPRRVRLNGELTYYDGLHLLYALPALFVLCTLGLVCPIVLLAYPMLYKFVSIFGCENTKVVEIITRIIRLKPLLDCIQGCFKDNFRFFAGLYFLYRWLFQLVYMSMGFSTYYVSVTVLLVLMLAIHGICQPYVKRKHNVVDSLLLANLTLINILAFYSYYKTQAHNHKYLEHIIIPAVVQLVLAYLPLVVMGIYLLVLMCNWCKHKFWFCPSPATCIPISHRNKLRKLEELVFGIDQNADSDEEDYSRDCDQSTPTYHRADAIVGDIGLDTY